MVENSSSSSSPRVSRKGERVEVVGPTRKKNKDAIDHEAGECCSVKYCGSCTAGVIADCVALCCCPCALLNLLTLALVKVPWKMGRKCLGFGKKKRNRIETARKCKKNACDCNGVVVVDDHNGRVEREMWEFSKVFGVEENVEDEVKEIGNFSARFEAEKVWFELYQVGQLGFGRVSFTGS